MNEKRIEACKLARLIAIGRNCQAGGRQIGIKRERQPRHMYHTFCLNVPIHIGGAGYELLVSVAAFDAD